MDIRRRGVSQGVAVATGDTDLRPQIGKYGGIRKLHEGGCKLAGERPSLAGALETQRHSGLRKTAIRLLRPLVS